MTEKELAAAQLEIMRAWRAVFMDESGALLPPAVLVLRDLEADFHQTRSTVAVDKEGRIDPLQMAVNEGKRAAFMFIKRRLYADLTTLIDKVER